MDELPSLKPRMPFATKLRGPFWVMRPPATIIEDLTLEAAIEEFVRLGLPAVGEQMCYVADRYGVMACGYILHPTSTEPEWFGVDEGFRALEKHPLADPLEVAMAEIMARNLSERR